MKCTDTLGNNWQVATLLARIMFLTIDLKKGLLSERLTHYNFFYGKQMVEIKALLTIISQRVSST